MSPHTPSIRTLSSEAPVGVQLAERFADFVKAFAIYPENNDRVRANLDALMETIEAGFEDDAVAPRGTITLSIHGERLRVGTTEVEPREGTNVGWLKGRLERSLLAGLKIRPGVPAESVVEFTRQLLEQYTRRQLDVEFEQLWSDEYPGLELLHRMFEGVFSPLKVFQDAALEGEEVHASGGLALDLGAQQVLANALAEDEAVRARIEQIEARLADTDAGRAGTHAMDVLGRITRLLPAEAMQEPDKLVSLATSVLDEVAVALEGDAREITDLNETHLRRILFSVGHRYFARDGVSPEAAAERLRAGTGSPRPRPGDRDAEITEDLELFRSEIGDLPALDEREAARRMEIVGEQLGVYLHFLVGWELERASALGPRVADLLVDAGAAELEVFASYLRRPGEDADEESVEAWKQRYRRLTSFLLAAGEVPLMRAMGLLGEEEVVRRFPEDFVLFLHALDPTDRRDTRLCAEVCAAIGSERFEREAAGLAENGGLLQWDLPRKLLAWQLEELLPLANQILAKSGDELRPAVVAYLRSLGLEAPEACLLRIVRKPLEIPKSYLFGLMQLVLHGAPKGPLERRPQTPFNLLIAREIGRFVRAADGDPQAAERRAYAVRFLGIFQGPESKVLLRELAGRWRFAWPSKVPAAVRRAARAALQRY